MSCKLSHTIPVQGTWHIKLLVNTPLLVLLTSWWENGFQQLDTHPNCYKFLERLELVFGLLYYSVVASLLACFCGHFPTMGYLKDYYLLFLGLLMQSAVWPSEGGNIELPNIVFVMADDLGYGDLHYYGGLAHTPNLDAMADGPNSIQFNRHYSGGPNCSPTRGTVLTGRNHNRYCIWTAENDKTNDYNENTYTKPSMFPLPTTEITVAEILKEHGYRNTAAFGKWHLGDFNLCPKPHSHPLWPISNPSIHGFDTWWMTRGVVPTVTPNCGCFNTCAEYLNAPAPYCLNYHSIEEDPGLLSSWPAPIEGDDSEFIYRRFAQFLQDSTQPFFAYIALHTVHHPFLAIDFYQEWYSSQGFNKNQTNYYGAITAMDDVIGQIRELLRAYNISHNTLLWFTSDNGPPEQRLGKDGPASTAGLRGAKATLYEGGIRVPGIIEWPAVIDGNQKTEFPVVTSDLLPTVCDILGVDPPTDRPIDGTSILLLLRGETSTRDKSIGWMYCIPNGTFDRLHHEVMMNNQYKLFATYENGTIRESELYDLAEDPSETRDVKEEHPKIFESLEEELEEWRQSVIWSANEEVKCVGYSKIESIEKDHQSAATGQ